jgi:hypothetical protein
MIPIGSAIGGLLVVGAEAQFSREISLRMPWLVAAAIWVAVFIYAAPKLTTEKIEAARAEGIAAKRAAGELPDDEKPASGEVASEAISEAGIAGAPPPIDEDSDK